MLIYTRLTVFACSLFLLLAACAPTVYTRGNLLDEEKLAQIKVGESTREEVAAKIGSPTQVGTFDENCWYYFGRRTEQYSFLDPEVTEQKSVEVHFDDKGVVTAVNKLDPSQCQEVNPVARSTPTYGHEMTFVEQLVGNLGHATKDPKAKKSAP